jgi:hypothetical protein
MKRTVFTALVAVALAAFAPTAVAPVRAADDFITQLATCQISWVDFKDDAAQMVKLADAWNASFTQKSGSRQWTPKGKVLVLGLPAVQGFPQSVGMGVGFSVLLDATLEQTKTNLEKAIGKPMKNCETGEGMHMCDLSIAEKRTLTLMSSDADKGKTTLLGCYYYYEK